MREADMLPGVLAHRQLLARGSSWRAFFEIPGPHGGIVDVVWVRFSRDALSRATTAGALDMTSIRTLQAINSDVPADRLPGHAGVGQSRLTHSVLPRLREAGWIERVGRSWVSARRYRPAASAVVTVELKRDGLANRPQAGCQASTRRECQLGSP